MGMTHFHRNISDEKLHSVLHTNHIQIFKGKIFEQAKHFFAYLWSLGPAVGSKVLFYIGSLGPVSIGIEDLTMGLS